jgi:hypothetical protein
MLPFRFSVKYTDLKKQDIIYFVIFYSAHQTHYEQMGHLNARITINDEKHIVEMPSFRDHSYGMNIFN